MTGLQEAFYIIGIIFMSLMLILIIALVIAVFVIRSKIIAIEKTIQEKIDQATNIASTAGELIAGAGSKAAKAVLNKAKKARR